MSSSDPLCQALGTTWWLELFIDITPAAHAAVCDDLIAYINQFEIHYSRFKADSWVVQLNRERVLKHPNPEFVRILQFGQTLYQETDGAFNILLGKHLELRGYDTAYSLTPSPEPTTTPHPLHDLRITPEQITLQHGAVDLGGFGKGYLIDLIAERLRSVHDCDAFLINGGGDMYATYNPHEPITIYLEHPLKPGHFLGTTTLLHEAFAASSPHRRSWTHHNKTYTHLVNTAIDHTQHPHPDATFIKHPSTSKADGLATTLLLSPPPLRDTYIAQQSLAVVEYTATTNTVYASPHFKPLSLYS